MYTYQAYRDHIIRIVASLRDQKCLDQDTSAEYLVWLLKKIVVQNNKERIQIPTDKRDYFILGIELKPKGKKARANKLISEHVCEAELITKLFVLKVQDATIHEQKILLLIHRLITLYQSHILFPDVADSIIAETNKQKIEESFDDLPVIMGNVIEEEEIVVLDADKYVGSERLEIAEASTIFPDWKKN